MAKVWQPNPTKPIGLNENLGRRLFQLPKLKGALDQQRPFEILEIDHFYEQRGAGEVSLDRLGSSGFDKKVSQRILPLCEAAAALMYRTVFRGWITVQAKKVVDRPPQIRFTVDAAAEGGNDYHAHVVPTPDCAGWITAMHLREIFCRHGSLHLTGTGAAPKGLFCRAWSFVIAKCRSVGAFLGSGA